jgi:hypothetical protein
MASQAEFTAHARGTGRAREEEEDVFPCIRGSWDKLNASEGAALDPAQYREFALEFPEPKLVIDSSRSHATSRFTTTARGSGTGWVMKLDFF